MEWQDRLYLKALETKCIQSTGRHGRYWYHSKLLHIKGMGKEYVRKEGRK
jgi:hypothetical protein